MSPTPFGEAVAKIGDRSPIGSAMLSSEWGDVPVALRERAFFSSQVESVRFLSRAQGAITDFLEGNRDPDSGVLKTGSRADFVDEMRAFALKEGMGPLDEESAHGLKDITSERRLGLIFDTQTRQANDYGYWRQGQDPDVLEEFPAQRFIRVREVKQERESHAQYEGQVYLKNDPIWASVINEDFGVPWGPWAWGCGHDVEDVGREELNEVGGTELIKAADEQVPETRSFNENLEASAAGLEPELIAKLKGDLGKQLVVKDDVLEWKPAEDRGGGGGGGGGGAAVSEAIDVQVKGHAGELVDAALAAIDQVHDDGVLPEVAVKETTQSVYGYFKVGLPKGSLKLEADHLAVRKSGPWAALTMAHETGHFLDLEAIGVKGAFATEAGDGGMDKVLEAAERTKAVAELRRRYAISGDGHLAYLLKPQEVWARAYAQFIAERSGNRTLERDLVKAVAAEKWRQWETGDFAALGKAIEEMMKGLGWMA